MSTNATVRIREKDGSEKGIYVHWDGYVEHTGVTLQLAYNTEEKVRELIALGNLSILGYYVNPKTSTHSFDNPDKDVCVAYHRDRGEDLEFYNNYGEQEFNYIFDVEDKCWYMTHNTYKQNTRASKLLNITYIDTVEKELLLDAILSVEGYLEDYWIDDDFATKDNVIETCIEKAKEARKTIVDSYIENFESNYHAFCD